MNMTSKSDQKTSSAYFCAELYLGDELSGHVRVIQSGGARLDSHDICKWMHYMEILFGI